ncbi:MAG: type IV secretion system DNA-binding domain-containing protein [Proteobacteria bacterium]|nr:type IV secretion system DNA-binding domain-containing protein [Pseudomonadota bacterium]
MRQIILISLMVFLAIFIFTLAKEADYYPFKPSLAAKYILSHIDTAFKLDRAVSFDSASGQRSSLMNYNYIAWYQSNIVPALSYFIKLAFATATKWFIVSVFSLSTFMYFKGRRQQRNKHIRGVRLVPVSSLKRQINIHNFKKFYFGAYKLGKIPFPKFTEQQHTIITGGSGTGKTQLNLDLIDQIRKRGDRAIIYDRMGNYVRKFYNPDQDTILNPFDQRSKKWDFFFEGNKRVDFDLMASSLIEESPRGADPYWTKAAKTVLSETASMLVKQNNPETRRLCEILLKSSSEEFMDFLSKTEASAIIDEKSEKTAASIRSVLATYINCLKFTLTSPENELFSVRNWIKNEDDPQNQGILFLSSSADKQETLKPLLTLWLDLAINSFLSLDQGRPRKLWIIIDELPSLQRLPALKTGLAESRQFGGAFVISMQLMSQLREIYGRDGAESISGLCRNRVIFSTPDQDTARWCSDVLGRKETLSVKENLSFGAHEVRDGVTIQETKELENIVLPSEVMSLKDLEFYIKMSNGFPISKSKLIYQDRPDRAKKIIEAVEKVDLELPVLEKKSKSKKSAKPKFKKDSDSSSNNSSDDDLSNQFFDN